MLLQDTKGQTIIEIVVISTVVLVLFLIVILTVIQKNSVTNNISKNSIRQQECDRISSLISNFASNSGFSETTIMLDGELDSDVLIKNKSISIGRNYCYYLADVKFQTGNGSSPAYTTDSTGFNLVQGTTYKIKKTDGGITFCDASESWC